MQGQRAQLLYDVIRIISSLQQHCTLPPAYLLENVNFQHHKQQQIAADDFLTVCSLLGQPIMFDAAQFGSLAHRVRNYWTNLAAVQQLAAAFQHAQRPAGRTVALALQPGRFAQPVTTPDRAPQYPCNIPGYPRVVWPTLMGRPQSYAFTPGQPGSVWDCSNPAAAFWDEPSALEREIALGYQPDSTAAAGVTEQQRRSALGQCMDANALQVLMAVSQAWWFASKQWQVPATCSGQLHAAAVISGLEGSLADSIVAGYPLQRVNCLAAAAQEALAAGTGDGEIWSDQPVLTVLQQGSLPADLSMSERKRVQRRLKLYVWDQQQQQLNRIMPDGTHRIVPPPADRLALVTEQHELCGHFGIRRTTALLHGKYWWHGMLADVRSVINRCQHCSRVRAFFSDKQEQLQSIPISSMGFRWHVDLAGPLPISKRGSRFVMVAIEAFSKYLVAVPIPNKEPETVAFAFLQHVLSRFAAPGQVVSDNGVEFTQGAFKQLLLDCLIDHCTTAVCHPRANGQAEKAVHIVKKSLKTMAIQKHETNDWDTNAAYLCLGYNCSPHSSTGYSPYHLMYARQPIVPPAIRSSLAQPIDYEDASAAAEDLHERQAWVQQHMPEALENLKIAQHRDQKRYAVVRSAGYQPKLHRFSPGDYVYVQQLQQRNTLQPVARESILRVLQVKPSGVLVLQGKCGQVAEIRQEHCAPCHLPDIDGTLDPVLVEHLGSGEV